MKMTFVFLFFVHFSAFSQCDTSDVSKFPEVSAEFPGGIVELKKFIQSNLDYPDIKGYLCEQYTGTIYLKFIVCTDGSINNVICERCSNTEFDQIAIELINKMPKWIPAEMNDLPITSYVRFPLRIGLQ